MIPSDNIVIVGLLNKKSAGILTIAVLHTEALALPVEVERQRAEPTLMYIIVTPEFPHGNMARKLHTRRRLPLLRS